MVISGQLRKLEGVKKTQYVKGKNPKMLAFSCPAWILPYVCAYGYLPGFLYTGVYQI